PSHVCFTYPCRRSQSRFAPGLQPSQTCHKRRTAKRNYQRFEEKPGGDGKMSANSGSVITIKDLVVKVRFDEQVPRVGEILIVNNGYETKLLVDHLEPGGVAMCLNVRTDRRVQKGME